MQQAKRLFWDLDRDGSGSIESDEIMFMLRALGQNPTKEMVQKLIAEFDSVDKDGKIQLREFLEMYAAGFDSQNSHSTEDVQDSFRALDVDPFDEKAKVPKQHVASFLMDNYGLDVDIDDVFGSTGGEQELSLKHFHGFLTIEQLPPRPITAPV
mmetsp:Transcript_41237/g.102603  ORF Transcript_41237/g.102603 Transcript_41237/m.102603 type:complete len:154 (-) Transcript_41237:237-698(-)